MELPPEPTLIVALEGWIDPGYAAATALGALLDQFLTRTLAVFNSDDIIDQASRRAWLRVEEGVRGRLFWPSPRLRVGTDRADASVAFLVGPEPDYRWSAFASEVADLVVELGTRRVIGLGAFPAPTPHTRPLAVVATSSDPELAREVGFVSGGIVVPIGIGDVIGERCAEAGIPSLGLWARMPHYVSGMAYPAGAVALLERLASLTGFAIDTSDLQRSARRAKRRVDDLIAQSEEHSEMVRQLEEQADEEEVLGAAVLPSGDELAEELERYLRGELEE